MTSITETNDFIKSDLNPVIYKKFRSFQGNKTY